MSLIPENFTPEIKTERKPIKFLKFSIFDDIMSELISRLIEAKTSWQCTEGCDRSANESSTITGGGSPASPLATALVAAVAYKMV